jgi:hypothetical protein
MRTSGPDDLSFGGADVEIEVVVPSNAQLELRGCRSEKCASLPRCHSCAGTLPSAPRTESRMPMTLMPETYAPGFCSQDQKIIL